MKKMLISLHNINKQFGGQKALDDVSLDIEWGKSYCLIGENGSGKSTLIKICTGVYKPTSGSLTIDGLLLPKGVTPRESIELGIDVIYQDFQLFPNLSVAENIMIEYLAVSEGILVKWNHLRDHAKATLAKLDIHFDVDKPVSSFSTADRQLISIAKAIAKNARCIIMDEPTTALTQKEVDILFSIVRNLNRSGVTTIFVSHKISEVMEVAEHFIVLRNGVKVFDCPAEGVDRATLVSHMSGRKESDGARLIESVARENRKLLLEVQGLSSGDSFSDITFRLSKGEIIGITGLIGSGIQELAKTLFGLKKATSGRIVLEGEVLSLQRPLDAVSKGIALVPADRLIEGLSIDKTIGDNIVSVIIDSFQQRLKIDINRKFRIGSDWVKKLSVKTQSPEAITRSLSGGNQQKVLLAKWLITNPKILILVSPTVGVDIFSKLEIHLLAIEMAKEGKGIIVISDDIPELYSLTEKVFFMKDGRMVQQLDLSEASEEDINRILLNKEKASIQ